MMKKNNLKINHGRHFYLNFYLIYTLLFALLAFGVFFVFYRNDISLIHSTDSWRQHYKALMYYSDYLRTVAHNLFTFSRPIIPQWDFNVGIGSDIITTFHYYALGDPLNLISVFVPTDKIYILFQALFIARIYLAGVAFTAFNFVMKNRDYFAVLAGAITYIFCGFTFFAAVKHPYFMNAMIYIPLLFIGAERIFQKRSPVFFTFVVGVSAMSNFYFFYMYVIMTVVYVLFRLICLYKTDIRSYFAPFSKIAVGSVAGVMMSAVILLPVITAFLSDKRASNGHSVSLLFEPGFYERLPAGFISVQVPGHSLSLCFSCVAFISIITLFAQRKRYTSLKVIFLITSVLVTLPIIGKMMNGFSYPTCRWAFVYNFIVAYIVAVVWPCFKSIPKKKVIALVCVTAVYCAVCIGLGKYDEYSLGFSIALLAVAITVIILMTCFKGKKMAAVLQCVLLGITALSVVINAFFVYSGHGNGYSKIFVKNSELPAVETNANIKIKEASKNDNSFFRYEGDSMKSVNSACISKLNGISYYWSMSNPYITQYRRRMNLNQEHTYKYFGFDNRAVINALAGVKYACNYVNNNAGGYGYRKTDVKYVYENEYALPFGYTYESYIDAADTKELDSITLQELMLSSAVIDTKSDVLKEGSISPTCQNVEFTAKGSEHINIKDNRVEVKSAKGKVRLSFNGKNDSETYLCLRGIRYINTDNKPLNDNARRNRADKNHLIFIGYRGRKKVVSKDLLITTPEYTWYEGLENYDINLGYHEKGLTRIEITCDAAGTFEFDDISIVCQPMKNFGSQIEKLRQDVLTDTVFSTNTVSGRISLTKPKMLCMSVPYADGWSLYVDSEKTEPVMVNGLYIGTELSAGDHEIQIVYNTPNLKLGAVISAFGFALLIAIGIVYQVLTQKGLSRSEVKKNKSLKGRKHE